jgi:hypothetical protein
MPFPFEDLTVYQRSLDLVETAESLVMPVLQVLKRKGLVTEEMYLRRYCELEAVSKMLVGLEKSVDSLANQS